MTVRMTTRLRTLLVLTTCVLSALATKSSALAANPPGMPPRGKILLGMGGTGTSIARFDRMTGARHAIHLISPPWGLKHSDGTFDFETYMDTAEAGGFRVMVHLDVKDGSSLSPGQVAAGGADASLLEMSEAMNERDQFVYVRPPAEMNGHWSGWAAFKQNGSRRPAAYSTANYRRAFIRITSIMRGGSVAGINARLRANGMTKLRTSETTIPSSGKVMMVWNPQAEGSPNVRGNQPIDFYPGKQWVDYFATDIYEQSGKAAWAQNERFYQQFQRAHPFMIAEFAPWDYDGAPFVSRMFAWARSHPRTVALMYFNGTSSTRFTLARKPRSLAAYKVLARGAAFRCPGISATSNAC